MCCFSLFARFITYTPICIISPYPYGTEGGHFRETGNGKAGAFFELGGTKKDITLLVISGIALIVSIFDLVPLPFDASWAAIILCGIPIILEAVIGLVTAFDIKANVLVSLALIASVCIGEDFAAGEVAFIMQLGGLLEELTVARARAGIEKLVHIRAYQAAGDKVCMIGDGVNDAPALKAADVGIAMGCVGSDIAVDAADIALVDDEVKELPHLIALSKRMMRTIKLNITFSLTLNFIAIVLAITGTLNPVVGALVHNAGSVLVITNSALLLKWRRTASQISRPQTRNLFDRKFRRQARRNLLFARSACRSHSAGGKARSAANPFQKEWIAKLQSTLFDFLLFSAPDRGH